MKTDRNTPAATSSPLHVAGIDSLRFISALCVFFSHGGAPPVETLFETSSPLRVFFHGLTGVLWNGPAAVVIFFVISGFCIHYPYAVSPGRRLILPEFYSRRFLRLLIPVAVATPLGNIVGVQMGLFHLSILWSLLAELIYYICYPFLRWAYARTGSWLPLVAGAYAVSLVLIASNPSIPEFALFSPWVVWLLGLPSWLLGCMVAQSMFATDKQKASHVTIWGWRLCMVSAVCVCSVLRFHASIGYPWTFAPLAVLTAGWLQKEVFYHRHVTAWKILEWSGKWSYSLYLIHMLVVAYFRSHRTGGADLEQWGLLCLSVLAAAYAFYLIVEKPSHWCARWSSNQFRSFGPTQAMSLPAGSVATEPR